MNRAWLVLAIQLCYIYNCFNCCKKAGAAFLKAFSSGFWHFQAMKIKDRYAQLCSCSKFIAGDTARPALIASSNTGKVHSIPKSPLMK